MPCAAGLQLPSTPKQPCVHYSHRALQASVAVRFCPRLFARSQPGEDCRYPGQAELPYKMVFAIATFDAVTLYSTEVCAGQCCSPDAQAIFTFCRTCHMSSELCQGMNTAPSLQHAFLHGLFKCASCGPAKVRFQGTCKFTSYTEWFPLSDCVMGSRNALTNGTAARKV